ncbi:ATXN2 family protein [Megaselia abdita]
MMNNKRKNRTMNARYTGGAETRQVRGSRSIVPQGVYNNTYFIHGATALVGHLVQVHLRSGSVYEGVFRTFSPVFDVALELPSCIKSVNKNTPEENKNLTNCMIFTYDNIVSIVAKDYDPNYVYSGTFQTDSAISERCNGSGRLDEKELEPWDASGMNGGVDFDLDGQNGWDADEMFSKNERNFGVQSTFDDSLSDYTVPIDVKETAEFREAEAKAEKLANEIESNPSTKDRLNLENGDEEALFAAVERPPERANASVPQQPQPPLTQQQQTTTDSVNNSKVPMPVVSNKPKSAALPTPPGSMSIATTTINVNTQSSNPVSNVSSSSSSVSSSSTNKSTSTLSSGEKYIPPQQKRKPIPPTNNKNMSRITSSPNNIIHNNSKNNYPSGHQSQQQNSGPPQYAPYNVHGSGQYRGNVSHNKMNNNDGGGSGNVNNNPKPMQQRSVRQYNPSMASSYNDQQNQSHVFVPQTTMTINQGQQHSVPQQSQSQRMPKRDDIEGLRKFGENFNIVYATPGNQPPQGAPMKNPQPSISPGTQQQQQQQQPVHQKTPQIQNLKVHVEQQTNTPSQPTQQQNVGQPEPQSYQMQTPPTNIDSHSSGNPIKPVVNATDSPSDKSTPPTVAKKHVLNPAAIPFIPRSPSTPTQSRPHTPQTPVPTALPAAGIFAGPHVQAAQHPMYVIQQHPQQPFPQASAHPGVQVQQGRLRRPQIATQMQVSAAAATGQPLLTGPFLHYQQTATHPSHFQTQPYQQMVRYYSEPPPQPVQFLAQTPPSTTPSPGQHQQFHQPQPQPSPQTGAPQQFVPGGQQQPQPTHYQVVPVIQPQLVSHYYQNAAQNPNQAQHFQIVMPQHTTQ